MESQHESPGDPRSPTARARAVAARGIKFPVSERLRHVVEASKTAVEGGALGKPTGVRGVQLWRKMADPAPTAEWDFESVSEFTRARMTLKYQMTEGAQTVFYQARWGSTRGETCPWGEMVSATVVK